MLWLARNARLFTLPHEEGTFVVFDRGMMYDSEAVSHTCNSPHICVLRPAEARQLWSLNKGIICAKSCLGDKGADENRRGF